MVVNQTQELGSQYSECMSLQKKQSKITWEQIYPVEQMK